MEKSTALDDESHLVFIVPMLAIKLRQHRFQLRSFGFDIDYIRSSVGPTCFEPVNFLRVGGKNLLGA